MLHVATVWAERIPAIVWTLVALEGVAAQAINLAWARFTLHQLTPANVARFHPEAARAVSIGQQRLHAWTLFWFHAARLALVLIWSLLGFLSFGAPTTSCAVSTYQALLSIVFVVALFVGELVLNGIASAEIVLRLRQGAHLWPRGDG